jgi:arylsulfatase A-like enzyme
MLGDWEDDWGKEMPWMGSVNVPLVVIAPSLGLPQGVVVEDVPVATLDLAGTFLDWSGATPGVNMTTRSLRPFLQPGAVSPVAYRGFVSSSLAAWRAVLQSAADGAIYKLICCRGACPGQPTNATAGALARPARTV